MGDCVRDRRFFAGSDSSRPVIGTGQQVFKFEKRVPIDTFDICILIFGDNYDNWSA